MKITIDTVNKTIEIEQATVEDIIEFTDKYKGYSIVSKTPNYNYPWYVPHIQLEPYKYDYTDWQVTTSTGLTAH